MKKLLGIVSYACLLAACSEIPPQAYYNRGDPENLIDVSSEVVNLSLSTPGALTHLSSMVSQDLPARAELNCSASETLCAQAKEIFERHNVPTKTSGSGNGVTLVYERVTARDCEQRYIDNSINSYNLNYPTFGCSVAGNTVQMVSDKRQFSSPNLLDFQDGEKAAQSYENYLKPASETDKAPPAPIMIQTGGVSR